MRIGINFLYLTFLVSVFFPPEVGRQYKHPLTKELELIQKIKDFALPLLIINTCLLNFEILIICALLSSTDQIVIVDKCGYVTKALLFIETIGWRRQPTIVCVFSECCLKISHKYSTQHFRIVLSSNSNLFVAKSEDIYKRGLLGIWNVFLCNKILFDI